MSKPYAVFTDNNALLIQGAHTQPTFMDMLRVTMQRHTAYCNSHKFDYWCQFGNPCPDRTDGAWDKVHYLNHAVNLHYEYIIWLDSDTCINRFDIDLRDALEGCEITAACHDPDRSKYLKDRNIAKHHNVGALYFKNTPLVKEFIAEWYASYPGDKAWFEQGAFNELIKTEKYAKVFKPADDTWNATVGVNMVEEPNVIGWHGTYPWAKRVEMMKQFTKNDFLRYKV